MTQHYVGTKIVEAWPAQKDGADGYSVKYADGYISWSPKDVFEAAYLPLGHIAHLPPHVQRMAAEMEPLYDRLEKLKTFIRTPAFAELPVVERHDLAEQCHAMDRYCSILKQRLNRARAAQS